MRKLSVPWIFELLVQLALPGFFGWWAAVTQVYSGPTLALAVLACLTMTVLLVNQLKTWVGWYRTERPIKDSELRRHVREWLDRAGFTLEPDDPLDGAAFRFVARKDDRAYTVLKLSSSNRLVLGLGIHLAGEHKDAYAALPSDTERAFVRNRTAAALAQLDLHFQLPVEFEPMSVSDDTVVADRHMTPQVLMNRMGALARAHVVISTAISLALAEISRGSAQ